MKTMQTMKPVQTAQHAITQNTISLVMIVKNEANHLPGCLRSVQGQVDEIIIVDTGSTDDTLEIARQFTEKVYTFAWCDDFSAARNYAISQASSDWILALDADEELIIKAGNLRSLINLIQKEEAYLLPLYNPTGTAGEYNTFYVLRLFKNNGKYRYSGMIHEQVTVTEAHSVGKLDGLIIQHQFLPPKERRRKRERNLKLLKKAYQKEPQNPFLNYYLGVEWLMLGKPSQALSRLRQAYESLTDENLLFRAPALRYLIICLHALGCYDEGICLCLEAELHYPDFTDIYYLCGILFEEKKEYALAIQWLNQAIQSGHPPAVYSHLAGSESYLAYYHLGYCYEQLGQNENALDSYDKALQANPAYIYPVYNLFQRLLLTREPRQIMEYLEQRGYLTNPQLSFILADLFFTTNSPELACQCLKQIAVTSEKESNLDAQFLLGKYEIYSGNLRDGIKHFNTLATFTAESPHYGEAKILSVIAYLLLGNFPLARAYALELWQEPKTRCEGYILSCLIRYMEKGKTLDLPSHIREKEVYPLIIKLLVDSRHYLPDQYSNSNFLYERFILGLESLLKSTSPHGYWALQSFYHTKVQELQAILQTKFGMGWVKL